MLGAFIIKDDMLMRNIRIIVTNKNRHQANKRKEPIEFKLEGDSRSGCVFVIAAMTASTLRVEQSQGHPLHYYPRLMR